IAAAASNNAAGVAGTSWGARIMPVKVLNASKSGTFANAAAGIIWATDHGAHIINLSLGGNSHSAIFQNAIDYAYGNGVVIVAASGNAGNGFILYPARYANVIAVGATNAGNNRAAFSNYGAELDLVAPGDAIYSTGINTYFYDSGTSMSAPYVSGLAAILRGIPGSGSPANIAWAMKITALDLGIAGRDDLYGSGLIQMDAAIQLLWPTSTPTPTSTQTVSSSGQTGFGFGSGSPNAEATLTPTATSTQIAIASPTLLATITLFPSPDAKTSPEPELFALSTPARVEDSAQEKNNDYILPCLGSFLILFGIFLLWLGFRLKKKKNKLF
ncbi:MAG: S8 family serine peptidase, partial [Chloroflexi bacterium]|nr:S8 family serine peptidase [Chloroflexota bacterium]